QRRAKSASSVEKLPKSSRMRVLASEKGIVGWLAASRPGCALFAGALVLVAPAGALVSAASTVALADALFAAALVTDALFAAAMSPAAPGRSGTGAKMS